MTFLRISVSDEAILRKHKHVSFYQNPYSFKNENTSNDFNNLDKFLKENIFKKK